MAKIRVHELSKQMSLPTKDILSFLGEGFSVQSGLDEAQVEFVKEKARALEKSKSLEKKAVLVKAVKRPEKTDSSENAEKTVKEAENIAWVVRN